MAVEFEAGLVRKIRQFDGGNTTISYSQEGPHAGLVKQVSCPNGLPLAYTYDQATQLSRINVGDRSQVVLDYDGDGRIVGYTWRPAKRK